MVSEVAIGPSVEPAIPHRRHVVRHEVAAKFVALVDGRPEHAGFGLPRHADRVSQPRGKHAMPSRLWIDLQNRCTLHFEIDAVFGDVAVRADSHVEARTVWRCDQTLRPVMVETPTW